MPESLPASSDDVDLELVELFEELTRRVSHERGSAVERFLAEHPAHADRLREMMPALGALAGMQAPAVSMQARLGDFEIVREIGRGGMGVVYEAIQRSLDRCVALKVLPPQSQLSPRFLERFQREAKAAALLHHTNIVPVFGVGQQDGIHFYAMQYIAGSGLDAVLRSIREMRSPSPPGPGPDATFNIGPPRTRTPKPDPLTPRDGEPLPPSRAQ